MSDGSPAVPSPAADAGSALAAPEADRRRRRVGVVIAVAVVAVIGLVVLVARPDRPTYDDSSQSRFLDACTSFGGEPARSTCDCLYRSIETAVPFDRFEVISDNLASQDAALGPDDPVLLPDDVQAMLDVCLAAPAPS